MIPNPWRQVTAGLWVRGEWCAEKVCRGAWTLYRRRRLVKTFRTLAELRMWVTKRFANTPAASAA